MRPVKLSTSEPTQGDLRPSPWRRAKTALGALAVVRGERDLFVACRFLGSAPQATAYRRFAASTPPLSHRSLPDNAATTMTTKRFAILTAIALLSAYLASGLTIIQPDEVGVARRFGAVLPDPWEPGLHWGLPWGIDRVDRVKPQQARTIRVGAASREVAPLLNAPEPADDDFLSGDLNLVTAECLVQYRARDVTAYLFRSRDVELALKALSRWALVRALAERTIDELLTTGRAEVAARLGGSIQALADQQGLGVSIVAVRLGRLAPPAAVAPAFADAARARSDRRQAGTRALEYRDRSQSLGQGQAREIADAAAGRFDRIVQPARGEAERFAKVLAEARKSAGSYERRMFLETVAELLPRFRRTVVVAPGQNLDISVLMEDELIRADGVAKSREPGRPGPVEPEPKLAPGAREVPE
jgi:membrane protease subunit HflK